MKITNFVDSAYLIRFCSAGAYLKYVWLCHDLRLGVQKVVTKPWSNGISFYARGTDEVVNFNDIIIGKKRKGKLRNLGNNGRTKK